MLSFKKNCKNSQNVWLKYISHHYSIVSNQSRVIVAHVTSISKIDIFQQGNDRMSYMLVYLHSSRIGLETRPRINPWGLGLTTLLIILIVHSNGEIRSSRKPVSGCAMFRQVVIITYQTCINKSCVNIIRKA